MEDLDTNNNLRLFALATANEVFDLLYEGGTWMVESVRTIETLEDFDKAVLKYAEYSRSQFSSGEIAGFKYNYYGEVQVRKGAQRRPLSVIDLGAYRYALKTDLTCYGV